MTDLVSEMNQCNTVEDCFEMAMVDTYDEGEVLAGWHACLESMFGRVDLDSIKLKNLTPKETLWLKAWNEWGHS
jgi:hypothetical protein